MVNVAINQINVLYKEYADGEISKAEAKDEAIKMIYSARYNIGDSQANYIWINTIDGIMVVDPPKPELNGKNVWDFKDKNGVSLFRDMERVVKTNGFGYVHYCWPKLGKPKNVCYPKMSYVRLFYPWQWIVGSGFYLDSIQKQIDEYSKRKKHEMFRMILLSFLLGGGVSCVSGVVFYVIISRMVYHLYKVGEVSGKFVYEEINKDLKLPYESKDELGYLVGNFNAFIDENYKLSLFKKTIEEDRDIESVYARIENLLKGEFDIKEFSVYEVNNSKNALKNVVLSGNELYCKHDVLIDSTLCRAARTASEVSSFEEKGVCLSFAKKDKKNHICIPLMIGGGVGSVIQIVFNNDIEYADVAKNVKRIKKFLKDAAPVIDSKRLLAQLQESNVRDPLTNLYNRRFLDEFASTFSESIKRRNTQVGILMCDIDFFKQVNDVYGHNIGDEMLKVVVNSIYKAVREADIAVRYGGEEFLILLQDVNENSALDVAERIRTNVESAEIAVSNSIIKKTVSIGVSIFPYDSEDFWKCVKYSDVAMYKAKESGRNRVVRFEESMWESEEY